MLPQLELRLRLESFSMALPRTRSCWAPSSTHERRELPRSWLPERLSDRSPMSFFHPSSLTSHIPTSSESSAYPSTSTYPCAAITSSSSNCGVRAS
eukprot:1447123-Rhodomonas_salina.1